MSSYWRVCLRRSLAGIIAKVLDCSFLYEPPMNFIKPWVLRKAFGAKVHPRALLLYGVRCKVWSNLEIGAYSYMAHDVSVDDMAPVKIGRGATISPHVFITAGGHAVEDLAATRAPITIGNGVFVGASAVILPGVTIGDHAIVAAGAVVTKDVAAYSVVAGVPAREISTRQRPTQVWTVAGMKSVEEIETGDTTGP